MLKLSDLELQGIKISIYPKKMTVLRDKYNIGMILMRCAVRNQSRVIKGKLEVFCPSVSHACCLLEITYGQFGISQ